MIPALNIAKLRLDMGNYVLSVAALTKRAGNRRLLDAVDLDVQRGAFVLLAGPAGAGKSLALKCIAGALKPDRGRIRYFGYEIGGRSEVRVAQMGIVRTHQCPQMFDSMSVLDSVTVGAMLRRPRLRMAQAHAREMLARCGLAACSARAAASLNVGERARLTLARALATDPQVLLLDDICAELDSAAARLVGGLLSEVRQGGVTIVATDRRADRFEPLVDEIVAIDGGRTARKDAYATLDV